MRNNFKIYAALSRKEFEFGEKKVSSSKDNPGTDLQKCRDDDWMVQICDNQSRYLKRSIWDERKARRGLYNATQNTNDPKSTKMITKT